MTSIAVVIVVPNRAPRPNMVCFTAHIHAALTCVRSCAACLPRFRLDAALHSTERQLEALEAKFKATVASLAKLRARISGVDNVDERLSRRHGSKDAWRGESIGGVSEISGIKSSDATDEVGRRNHAHHTRHARTAKVAPARHSLDGGDTCLGAFIIFNNRESYERCMYVSLLCFAPNTLGCSVDAGFCWSSYDYRYSASACCRRYQPPPLRFRGFHSIKVKRAPEPSTIVWDNLDSTCCDKCCRRAVTSVVSAALLLLCVVLFATAQVQRKRLSTDCFGTNMCEFELPATYYQVDLGCTFVCCLGAGCVADNAELPCMVHRALGLLLQWLPRVRIRRSISVNFGLVQHSTRQ